MMPLWGAFRAESDSLFMSLGCVGHADACDIFYLEQQQYGQKTGLEP